MEDRIPSFDYNNTDITQHAHFPTVENILGASDRLFLGIRSGEHDDVEKILSDRGHEVKIVPRIGCPALHYTKFNLANWETENGDNPLIMAARVDSRMVEIVLKYGGNPNHANKARDTPLSVAAGRCDQEAIDALLLAGANLRAAVVKLTSLLRYITSEEQEQGYSELACSVKSLTVLLSKDVYLKCRCPIKTAFDVARDVASIKHVRDEFKIEFELLIEDADRFACRFLNSIDRMWEAKEILTAPVDLITMAIDHKKKKFVSHPFSQQIINGRWYGDLVHKMFFGKTLVVLEFMFSPFLVLPLMLKFFLFDSYKGIPVMDTGFGRLLRLKFTPCLCFVTDSVNYIMFLVILICVCLDEQTDLKWLHVTNLEWALYVCVVSRIVIELDNMVQQGWWRYCANVWNYVDNLILVLLTISAIYKIWIDGKVHGVHQHDNRYRRHLQDETDEGKFEFYRHFMNISYIHAVAEFVLFVRFLTLLEVTRSMGPMLIALKYLLAEVLKFSVVLLTTVVGTSIAIYSMNVKLSVYIKDAKELLCDDLSQGGVEEAIIRLDELTDNKTAFCDGTLEIEPPAAFESFLATVTSIMWSTFGLFEVSNVSKPFPNRTITFINVILVLYILLSCVLLLNMLIGILSTTFDRIQSNCDTEWKYARSELLKEYSGTQPFLMPFSTLLLPVVYWFRRKLREEQRQEFKKSFNPKAGKGERDKITSEMCERYKHSLTGECSDEEYGTETKTGSDTKRDNFDARVRRLRNRFRD